MKLEFPTKKTVVWSKSSSRTALLYNEFIQVSLVANVWLLTEQLRQT